MSFKIRGRKYRWNFTKLLINLTILLLVFGLGFTYLNNIVQAGPLLKTVSFTVGSGETLWSLAERIAPEVDPRITINDIKSRNHLESSNLKAGQKLQLPIAVD